MRIIVTGGCGFIGSHIVDQLIEQGHEVSVVDNLSTGKLENLNKNAVLYQADIRGSELDEIFAKVKPEAVYHEAAQIDIQHSIKEPCFDADVNVVGTINVLEKCRLHGVRKIIYASSAAIYGNPEYLGIDERHPIHPISFYGISKYTPENYIRVYSELYGLEYTILRYANVYGPRQDVKGEGGVVSIFIGKIGEDQPLTIFGNGEQTRDFIYVKDIAAANVAALTRGRNEAINVGTGTALTVNALTEQIIAAAGKEAEVLYLDERPGDIVHSYFDNSKLKNVLGFTPSYPLDKGLAETVAFVRGN